MTCPRLHYVHINILLYIPSLALRKSQGKSWDLWQGLQIREEDFLLFLD